MVKSESKALYDVLKDITGNSKLEGYSYLREDFMNIKQDDQNRIAFQRYMDEIDGKFNKRLSNQINLKEQPIAKVFLKKNTIDVKDINDIVK
jgi:hypothetical protein